MWSNKSYGISIGKIEHSMAVSWYGHAMIKGDGSSRKENTLMEGCLLPE